MRSLSLLFVGVVLYGSSARGAGWYADKAAGVRFPLPFEDGERKTGEQIRGLILDLPEAAIPEGLEYTSGLYAKAGLPYLLLWVRQDSHPPTQAELADQGFDSSRLDKVTATVVLSRGGIKSRTLIKVLKGQTAFVGLYFQDDRDGALLDHLRQGLEAEPELAQTYAGLPPGSPSTLLTTLVAASAGIIGAGIAWWVLRKRRVY